jgi:hypothetical protein
MSARFEIAIWKKDALRARTTLEDLAKAVTGDSLRGRAYLRGAEVRLLQLDPNFDCDDRTLQELEMLHEAAKTLMVADGMTVALGEALKRRGRLKDLSILLQDYLHHSRRDRAPISPPLAELVAFCENIT